MFNSDSRNEIHNKLDALLDTGFVTVAALITQLHFEAFFRKNLPEGYTEERTQARILAELPRLADPALTSDEEFQEATFGDEAYFEFLEALVGRVVRGYKVGDAILCDELRKELKALGSNVMP